MKVFATVGLTLASICPMAIAQTERELGSHEHGAAGMNVGVFDNNVSIELNSPWNNLVGFEYAPKTEEELKAMEDAIEQLNNPDKLFGFNGAECKLADSSIDSTMSMDEHDEDGHDDEHHDEDGHDDEHHDEDGHDDEHHDEDGHDDEHHDEDGHDDDKHGDDDGHGDEHHDEHDHDEETHSSVSAFYNFLCDNAQALESIDVSLFSIWTGFEEIDVQMAGDKGQSFAELGPDQTTLDVSQIR